MKSEFTFDQWLEKVFTGRTPSWSWLWNHALKSGRAEWLVSYPTRLFREPEFLLEKYSDKQLRKGFWSLPVSWELRDSIWDKDLPRSLRKACIQAMVPLFDKFFARQPLGDTCHMWWDLLRLFSDDADVRVKQEMYRALQEILSMASLHCQIAALHGLGHLDDSRKVRVIRRYLEEHPDLPADIREYASASIKGIVL